MQVLPIVTRAVALRRAQLVSSVKQLPSEMITMSALRRGKVLRDSHPATVWTSAATRRVPQLVASAAVVHSDRTREDPNMTKMLPTLDRTAARPTLDRIAVGVRLVVRRLGVVESGIHQVDRRK